MKIWLIQVVLRNQLHYFLVTAELLTQLDAQKQAGHNPPDYKVRRGFETKTKAKTWCKTVHVRTSSQIVYAEWLKLALP